MSSVCHQAGPNMTFRKSRFKNKSNLTLFYGWGDSAEGLVLEKIENRKFLEDGTGKARTEHSQPSCDQDCACCLACWAQGHYRDSSRYYKLLLGVEVFLISSLSFNFAQVWYGWIRLILLNGSFFRRTATA